jgi:hypothetical protein
MYKRIHPGYTGAAMCSGGLNGADHSGYPRTGHDGVEAAGSFTGCNTLMCVGYTSARS